MKKGDLELYQYGVKSRRSIQKINNNGSLIYYQIETSKGMNGCPLFFGDSFIGIHIGSDKERNLNTGRLFDGQLV